MKHKPPILWQVLAEEYDKAAQEHYHNWKEYLWRDCPKEAECEYDLYLEQKQAAQYARKKAGE